MISHKAPSNIEIFNNQNCRIHLSSPAHPPCWLLSWLVTLVLRHFLSVNTNKNNYHQLSTQGVFGVFDVHGCQKQKGQRGKWKPTLWGVKLNGPWVKDTAALKPRPPLHSTPSAPTALLLLHRLDQLPPWWAPLPTSRFTYPMNSFLLLLTHVLFCFFLLSQANFLTQEQINGKTLNSTGLLNVSDVCGVNEARAHRAALVHSEREQSLPAGQLRHKRFCVRQGLCRRDWFKGPESH